jgi:hypothetical protein
MEASTAYDKVRSILKGHRLGHFDLQQAVNLLQVCTIQQPEQARQKIFQILWSELSAESLTAAPAQGQVVPSVHAVVIRSIASFGPTADLPDRVFGLLMRSNPTMMEFWGRDICPQLSYSMSHNASRFAQATLDQAKTLCATCTFANAAGLGWTQFPESVVEAAAQLRKTVERIEYLRFAKSLQESDPTPEIQSPELDRLLNNLGLPNAVATAMSKAEKSLRGDDLFDPKTAVGLIRTSMDEIHRAMITELGTMTGRQCPVLKKDGQRRAYLRQEGFISQPEEKFFSSIYTLVSEEGTHELIVEKETVLFMETIVRHYLLLLLRRLLARRTAPPSGTAL